MTETTRGELTEQATPYTTDRRTILTRGAAVLAGLAGAKVVRSVSHDSFDAQDAVRILTSGGKLVLTGRGLRLSGADMPPRAGDRLSGAAELMDSSGHNKIGEFYSDCICVHAPF